MDIFNKILFIGPNYNNRGGISTVLKNYKENIKPFHYQKSSTDKGLLINICLLITLLVKLVGLKCLGRVKILHLHGASRRSFQRKSIIITWAKILGFKIIFHCHGGGFKKYVENKGYKHIKNILNKCDAIIVLSESWREYFVNDLKQNRVYVVNNIISRPKKIYNKQDGLLHLLFLGLIIEEKGIFDLLDVINQHKEELNGKCNLIIGGTGIEENVNRLKMYIENNQLHSLVDYRGWVCGKIKEKAFADSNVFILPSYIEGLPISILEAMSNKMPIISTFVGSIPTIVTAANGTLVNPGDKSAIWSAIKKYIDHNKLLSEQGKVSGELAKTFYPETVINQLISIYSQL